MSFTDLIKDKFTTDELSELKDGTKEIIET